MAEPVVDQHQPHTYAARIDLIDSLIREADKHIRTNATRLRELAIEIGTHSATVEYKRGNAYSELYTGCALHLQAKFEEALPYYTAALPIFTSIQDSKGVSLALRYLGLAHHALCRYDWALTYYQQELDTRKQYFDTDIDGIAGTLTNIATMHLLMGQHDQALKHYLQSLTLLEGQPHNWVYMVTVSNIANLYMSLGEHEVAMEHQQTVLAIYREQGDEMGEANTLLNMGWNYNDSGKYDEALECNIRALALFHKQDNVKKEAIALLYVGQTYSSMKKYEEAFTFFQRSYKIAHDIGDKKNCTDILRAMGDMLSATEENEQAKEYYRNALEVAREIGMRQIEYELNELLARMEEHTGNAEAALLYYREYIRVKEEVLDERRRQAVSEMQIRFDVEQAEKEKEIYRLKNVELAGALEKVEVLNRHLSEANNEKNELMGIVAHDLKNPISGMSMSLSMLKTYLPRMSQQDVLHQIDQMNKTMLRMEHIVAKLLDLNILDSGVMSFHPVVFDLNETVLTVMDDYTDRMQVKNITAGGELMQGVPPVYADRGATLEVLDNLVSNAIKYSPHGTLIRISSSLSGAMARFEVQDSGPGIDPADHDKLFRKFVRLGTKPTGGESSTGLGLSIVKKLVDAMNGRVWCESEPGKGSTFILELPIAQ